MISKEDLKKKVQVEIFDKKNREKIEEHQKRIADDIEYKMAVDYCDEHIAPMIIQTIKDGYDRLIIQSWDVPCDWKKKNTWRKAIVKELELNGYNVLTGDTFWIELHLGEFFPGDED